MLFKHLGLGGGFITPKRSVIKGNHDYKVQILKLLSPMELLTKNVPTVTCSFIPQIFPEHNYTVLS